MIEQQYNSQQELEQRQQIFIIEDDLLIRYQAAAQALGITNTADMEDWLLNRTYALQRILSEYSTSPFEVTDMEAVREELQTLTEQFCLQTLDEGNIPVVISFDPLLLDTASYTMQENRVSINQDDIIDLAGNPKGKSNRFAQVTGDPRCGAGKTIDQQIAEFCQQLDGIPLDKIRLALVDGSIITGRTILHFLSQLPPELQANGVLAITGSTSKKGVDVMNQAGVAVESLTIFEEEPEMTVSLSDLVPTLGGRVIAERDSDRNIRPRTVEVNGQSLTMAVDAVMGGYPTHSDFDPFESDMLQRVREWSLQTGFGFWESLEQLRGSEISWADLAALNGKMKVMVPMRQGMSTALNPEDIPAGPKETILAAAHFGY